MLLTNCELTLPCMVKIPPGRPPFSTHEIGKCPSLPKYCIEQPCPFNASTNGPWGLSKAVKLKKLTLNEKSKKVELIIVL